jgi:type II secretory pathway component PulF
VKGCRSYKPSPTKGFFPEIAVHLLKVGEGQKLDQMLLKVTDNFDADVEHRMEACNDG